MRTFLQRTWLLGESLSFPVQNALAQHMRQRSLPAGYTFPRKITTKIFLLAEGAVQRLTAGKVYETLTTGDFFLEGPQFTRAPSIFSYRTITPTEVYEIPGRQLNQIPIVRWKLYETYKKRLRALFDPSFTHPAQFAWRTAYSVSVPSIDEQHQKLFEMTYDLHMAIESGTSEKALESLNFLLDYTRYHFETEEKLLEQYHYPELELHRIEHESLLEEVLTLQERAHKGETAMSQEVIKFILNWIVNHILTEDRRYSVFLSKHIEKE
jgi:hemerythrin